MGLWLGRLYLVTGIVVTAFTVAGSLLLGDWYWFWCRVTGGGTLIAAKLMLRQLTKAIHVRNPSCVQ